MTHFRHTPRRASLALAQVRAELAPQTLLAEAQQVWPQAVGAAIAAEAHPVREGGGVLTVSCSASVWAQELDLMAPAIIERLNGLLGSGPIGRLRCIAIPPGEGT